jgi:hypothetical protein
MLSFRAVTRDARRAVVLFTVVPPPADAAPSDIRRHLTSLEQLLLHGTPVAALHLPEVRPESRRPRVTPFVPKMEPRRFAHILQRELAPSAERIVDRGIVYTHWENQRRWLRKAWWDYHIRNLVLVGGESSRRAYPGPTVPQAARLIRQQTQHSMDYCLGGITIPTRKDEPRRLLEKTRCGMEFFLSQVMYESRRMRAVLREYHRLCRRDNIKPKRIFLSFAPISAERDVSFLRWWGVEVPKNLEELLFQSSRGVAERSIRAAGTVLRDLLEFVDTERLQVPLGLNIEHINQRNWEPAGDLAAYLHELYAFHLAKRSVSYESGQEEALRAGH